MAEVEAKRLEMLADVAEGKELEYKAASYVEVLRKRTGRYSRLELVSQLVQPAIAEG